MKKIIAFSVLFCCFISLHAQKIKLKHTINYNAFGMGVLPHDQLMVGGNHVFYKSIGFALSYRLGIKDIFQKNESQVEFQTIQNNLFTGKKSTSYLFTIIPSIAIAITRKIPLYLGLGYTRKRIYSEYLDKGNLFWIENLDVLLPTFTIGTFIPINERFLLNVAYDHLPQTVFIGIYIKRKKS